MTHDNFALKTAVLPMIAGYLLLIVGMAWNADHCILDGGTGDGSAWNNALDNLPSTLVRGDTYYIGDGNYGAYTFDDAESGTTKIFIRHANSDECSSMTGWNDTIGDEQAIFTISAQTLGILKFTTNYYDVDGVSGGGPNSWKSGHGFKIDGGSYVFYGVAIGASAEPVSNISLSHLEITGNRSCQVDQRGIQQAYGDGYLLISYCYIHDTYKDLIEIYHSDSVTIEYNFLGPNGTYATESSPVHSAGIVLRDNMDINIKYNLFEDISETGYICLVNDSLTEVLSNINVTGNVFYETRVIDSTTNQITFTFSRTNTTITNFKFINNTIINRYVSGGGNSGFYDTTINGGGNEITNNIWYGNTTNICGFRDWIHTYNYYNSNSWSAPTEDNRQVDTENIIVDMDVENFSLTKSTDAGSVQSSPFNVDMFGTVRGADGVWDRGAIEFSEIDTPSAAIYCSDTTLRTGQEVYFDSWQSIKRSYKDSIMWSYGDGYYLKNGWPVSAGLFTGPMTVHYYQKPGVYACSLFVIDTLGNKDTAIQNITVSGESTDTTIAGVEIWHPNFNARRSMYIDVKCSTNVTTTVTNKLSIYLSRSGYIDTILFQEDSLDSITRVLFVLDTIDSGSYTIGYVIQDIANDTISLTNEYFYKSYNDAPRMGIDYRNYLYDGDSLIFPITPYILDRSSFAKWDTGGYINCTSGIGYYDTYNDSTWGNYIDTSFGMGWKSYGPYRYGFNLSATYKRNNDFRGVDDYVDSGIINGRDTLWLGHSIYDEPNLGGRGSQIPPSVLSSWTYRIRQIDDNRPTQLNYYGFPWLDYYGDDGSLHDGQYYTYKFSAPWYGKKTQVADIIGIDHYPYEYSTHVAYAGRRVISEWINAFDKLRLHTMGTAPMTMYVETVDLHGDGYGNPTPAQIKMMCWLAITHGAVGINWFHYFETIPAENYTAMKNFTASIETYKNIILSDSCGGITDNSSENSNRVDFIYRKTVSGSDTIHYIFAVRLTEPDSSAYFIQSNEPDTITTTFSLPSEMNVSTVTVDGEDRSITPIGDTFQDKFYKETVHIYSFENSGVSISKKMTIKIRGKK